VEDSFIALLPAPGLGLDLDEEALARFPYREFPAREMPLAE